MMRKIQNAYLQQDEWGDQQVILIDPKTKEKIQIADCGKAKAIEARCEFTPAEPFPVCAYCRDEREIILDGERVDCPKCDPPKGEFPNMLSAIKQTLEPKINKE